MIRVGLRLAAGTGGGLVLAHGAWWTLLAVAALPRPRPRIAPAALPRLAVIVPAHNEELLLGRCLESLAAARGEPRPEVIVVADNCTDATAAVARAHGATVIEREDASRRGKSYALEAAVAMLGARPELPAACLFVDADTVVSPGLFEAVAGQLAEGAAAVQVHYRGDAGTSELARLRRLAFALVHWARPLGASRLGLGTGLKGNGMALSWAAIARAGLGQGITEDAALTLDLARAGIPVRFEPHAWVQGYMSADYADARVQDERWERGRLSLAGRALTVGGGALRRRQFAAAAGALEVATLPLSVLAALGVGASVAGVLSGRARLPMLGVASLVAYVATGLTAARAPREDVAALTGAPRFIVHKLRIIGGLAGASNGEWRRTERRAG